MLTKYIMQYSSWKIHFFSLLIFIVNDIIIKKEDVFNISNMKRYWWKIVVLIFNYINHHHIAIYFIMELELKVPKAKWNFAIQYYFELFLLKFGIVKVIYQICRKLLLVFLINIFGVKCKDLKFSFLSLFFEKKKTVSFQFSVYDFLFWVKNYPNLMYKFATVIRRRLIFFIINKKKFS